MTTSILKLSWIRGKLNFRAAEVLGPEFNISAVPRRFSAAQEIKPGGDQRSLIWTCQLKDQQSRVLVCSSTKFNGALKIKVLTSQLAASIIDGVYDEHFNLISPDETLAHLMNLRAAPILRKFYPRNYNPDAPDEE